jgi:hypothetical protein
MTFIQRVRAERRRTAEFLITTIDSYRQVERYISVWERNILMDGISRLITRYDRLTRIEHRLQMK